MICDALTEYYFSKTYTEPYAALMEDIGPVHYLRCVNCGFTCSKTHIDLDHAMWARLNERFHNVIEDSPLEDRLTNQPPYAEQAFMLSVLGKYGIVDVCDMVDYAGGRGTLSGILDKYFGLTLPIYDPYVTSGDSSNYIEPSNLGKYHAVINSAMFEHVVSRKDLDDVHARVKPDGVLVVHTVVCENIPKDPNWFYLAPPVHTAFHTNMSMEILMRQWGYGSSIYSPKSKCWVLFKEELGGPEQLIGTINQELQHEWFFHKRGFVDYWK